MLMFFTALLITFNVSAEIFKWVDKNGNVHFGDKKPSNQETEELKLKINIFSGLKNEGASSQPKFKSNKTVIIYTTSRCKYCRKAKSYFKKNKIAYTEHNIEKNRSAKRKFNSLGGKGVPLILVGKKRMNGFSKQGFERIYKNN